MENLIEIKNLCKSYDGFSLKNVSFSLMPGYIMGFVGQNGAGKSTTIKLMLNLLQRDGGEIKLFGLDNLENEREVKQKIGFVLDELYFHDNMTVKQAAWLVSGFYDRWNNEKFLNYAEKYKLPLKKKIKTLSTGMKAKLSLAMALSHGARLLILDEPTSGLDPIVRNEILSELYEIVQDGSCGVFFSTHITSDLDKVADFVTFLRNGEVILTTSKDNINDNYALVRGPKHLFAQVRDYIISARQSEFGFEAVSDRSPELRKIDGLVVEKVKIEDLMLYLEKGEMVC